MAFIGGTNGLGRALAHRFAAHGAEVIVVGRSFRDKGVELLSFIPADLSEMKQAKRVAEELPAETLDMLFFSNGVGPVGKRVESSEGIERDVAVSYLSRFVISRGVADRPKKTVRQGGISLTFKKCKLKGSAGPVVRYGPEPSAVTFNNRTTDR